MHDTGLTWMRCNAIDIFRTLFQQSWLARRSTRYIRASRTSSGVTPAQSYGYRHVILSECDVNEFVLNTNKCILTGISPKAFSCSHDRITQWDEYLLLAELRADEFKSIKHIVTVCVCVCMWLCCFYLVNFSWRSAEYCEQVLPVSSVRVRCKLLAGLVDTIALGAFVSFIRGYLYTYLFDKCLSWSQD